MRFGIFEADLRAGELRRNGSKIKLQDQPFQLLALLLERPGEVVTREELRGKLWPADTFVDFDHGLNAAVKRLRGALGDSAENPPFIETLSRRGYRFLVPVNGMAQECVPHPRRGPRRNPSRANAWSGEDISRGEGCGTLCRQLVSRRQSRPGNARGITRGETQPVERFGLRWLTPQTHGCGRTRCRLPRG